MKNVNRKLLRELIVEEILAECGCKAAAPDPRDLIPQFEIMGLESHPHFNMITDYEVDREQHALDAKCPGSYAKTADQLVINPEFVASIIKILMDKSGSTCPQSSAKALNDIVTLYNF